MIFSLKGLNALITGATGSIGRAIAIKLASQGADIVISGTREDIMQSIVSEVSSKTGQRVIPLPCDLSNHDAVSNLFSKAEEELGHIDILVNNAGITKDMLIMKMTIEDFEEVLNINLKSAFILTKSAVQKMSRRNFGRILNISSIVGFTGNPGQTNYCASKSALLGMSKAVALEYARRGITINCIAPGAIESPMLDKLSPTNIEKFLSKIPMGKIGTPEDIAFACCFMASKEASYITGQTIHVNGGMFMT